MDKPGILQPNLKMEYDEEAKKMMDAKEIAEFIQENTAGCRLVGVSSDNEIFLEFDHEIQDVIGDVSTLLKSTFQETASVVTVSKPNLAQLLKMVESLNESLGEPDELIDLEDF